MTQKTIMIVEDERTTADNIQAVLGDLGYTIAAVAFSGEEAIQQARQTHPDLILMDTLLKNHTGGLEAAEYIRDHFHIPVVYVTPYKDGHALRSDTQTESFGQVLNPFDERELAAAIEMALDKHEMEKARQSTRWLATCLGSIGDAVLATDQHGCVTFMNHRAEVLTGWRQEEVMGRAAMDVIHLIHEATHAPAENPITKVLRDGRASDLAHHNLLLLAKDRSAYPIDDGAVPIRDERDNLIGAVLVFRDVTERIQLQERLFRSRGLEVVGRLVGEVAHDFNNLLTVMAVYSELLMSRRRRDGQLQRYASEIKKAVEHASVLTGQLLAFSHKPGVQPMLVDLNAVIDKLREGLHRVFGENVELRTMPGAPHARVRVDPAQIEQVILNLVVNAHDAMPQGGMVTIETAEVEVDDCDAEARPRIPPGSYVMMAVSDTGGGVDGAAQSHPGGSCFATGEHAIGTGPCRGLSSLYKIINQSGGYVDIDSMPGYGTTFKIYLPRVDKAAASIQPIPHPKTLSQGSETILLVAEEEELRAAVCESLQMRGYTVLAAHHAREALMICERHTGPIHLLLTDVMMAQMTGPELLQQLAEPRPAMRVLYMSGYTSEALVQREVVAAGMDFLQKPFTPDVLAGAVRTVLDNPRLD